MSGVNPFKAISFAFDISDEIPNDICYNFALLLFQIIQMVILL